VLSASKQCDLKNIASLHKLPTVSRGL